MNRALLSVLLFPMLVTPAGLHADTLATNQWYEFSFYSAGVMAQGCYPADPSPTALNCLPSAGNDAILAPAPPWEFDLSATGGTLIVTDAFLYGDAFTISDYNVDLATTFTFTTPPVSYTGAGCGSDPAVCVDDPSSSHGAFPLEPGLQLITITPYATADAGAAYFEVATAVITPEPSELAPLLLISTLALWIGGRKRLLSI